MTTTSITWGIVSCVLFAKRSLRTSRSHTSKKHRRRFSIPRRKDASACTASTTRSIPGHKSACCGTARSRQRIHARNLRSNSDRKKRKKNIHKIRSANLFCKNVSYFFSCFSSSNKAIAPAKTHRIASHSVKERTSCRTSSSPRICILKSYII